MRPHHCVPQPQRFSQVQGRGGRSAAPHDARDWSPDAPLRDIGSVGSDEVHRESRTSSGFEAGDCVKLRAAPPSPAPTLPRPTFGPEKIEVLLVEMAGLLLTWGGTEFVTGSANLLLSGSSLQLIINTAFHCGAHPLVLVVEEREG